MNVRSVGYYEKTKSKNEGMEENKFHAKGTENILK